VYYAKIVFLDRENGGRSIPPQTGYHPQIDLGSVHTSCYVENLGTDTIFEFGCEHDVALTLMFPELYGGILSAGSPVRLYEGGKLVGSGTIIEDWD
jgi:hypothetical protein